MSVASHDWVRFESSLWRTTAVAVRAPQGLLLIDPGVSEREVAAIVDHAGAARAEHVAIIVTHTDWDHIAGIGAFPDAEVLMGPAAAARVRSGLARDELMERAAAYGLRPAPPRVDRELAPGAITDVLGLEIHAPALPGHTACSTGVIAPDLGLLAPGDYLSVVEYPFVEHSVAGYLDALAALAHALQGLEGDATVLPGHGPPLSRREALRVAAEDRAYLREVQVAVETALHAGAAEGEAVVAGQAVAPPRPGPEDLADGRLRTAEIAVQEALTAGH